MRKTGTAGLSLIALSLGAGAMVTAHRADAASLMDAVQVCGYNVFVTNSGEHENSVSVIDSRTNQVVATIGTELAPVNPTFTPDWTKVYVANSQAGSLSVLDSRTGKVLSVIPAGGSKPSGLRFTPDGKRLVITYLGETVNTIASLGVMDLASGEIVTRVTVEAQAERLDLSPDGKTAYVANLRSQSVSVVDLEAGKVIATVPTPDNSPFNVLVTPDGKRAYAGNVRGTTIYEIDTATNSVVATHKTSHGPNGMSFTPDYKALWFTTVFANQLQKLDLASGEVSEGIDVGAMPGFMRLTPDGKRAYFVRPYGTTVSVFDFAKSEIVATIETGVGPSTLAVCGNP